MPLRHSKDCPGCAALCHTTGNLPQNAHTMPTTPPLDRLTSQRPIMGVAVNFLAPTVLLVMLIIDHIWITLVSVISEWPLILPTSSLLLRYHANLLLSPRWGTSTSTAVTQTLSTLTQISISFAGVLSLLYTFVLFPPFRGMQTPRDSSSFLLFKVALHSLPEKPC